MSNPLIDRFGGADSGPEFSMMRIIDNGGELQPDGSVKRQMSYSDIDDRVTDDNPFPSC